MKEPELEAPSYFMCRKKDINDLAEKAKKEAADLLRELSAFYTGNFDVTIAPVNHQLCWSIAATLTLNGEPVKTEDPCDLLFLELNELMLQRLIDAGAPCFQNGGD